jgi:5-formyltetrahydrofolate cyclo-ligase
VSGGSGSSSERLKRAKRALRRDVIARRDALPERDRAAASLAIADRVAAMPEAREAGSAMAFWSFGSEVDTAPLIERWAAEGKVVALPRIEGSDVVPVAFVPGDPKTETSFGAMEPSGGRVLDPSELDLVIVPGVAFDRPGNRVGYGAGYYDRLLGRTRPGVAAVAIAFALQIVSEVPTGRTDRRVDAIVTETEVIRCRP